MANETSKPEAPRRLGKKQQSASADSPLKRRAALNFDKLMEQVEGALTEISRLSYPDGNDKAHELASRQYLEVLKQRRNPNKAED